ncbi:hypothetical protein BDF20DRAFT_890766 [Mycotypha africana]|uniref:uncharacterized protein n=1 Tax=Mycotypha africana TaxID=64632 RepID=UPI0023012803|nr:uncharacterized protein BDF20DRAFT_890766 [Mycotypha africana]KAI8970353.1 hypothetical protein BDF20DRAFT_890766 [Mycotypha africana]
MSVLRNWLSHNRHVAHVFIMFPCLFLFYYFYGFMVKRQIKHNSGVCREGAHF